MTSHNCISSRGQPFSPGYQFKCLFGKHSVRDTPRFRYFQKMFKLKARGEGNKSVARPCSLNPENKTMDDSQV